MVSTSTIQGDQRSDNFLQMIKCNDDTDGGHGGDHFGKSFDVQIDPLLLSFQEEGEYCNKQQLSLSFQQELREASAHQIG